MKQNEQSVKYLPVVLIVETSSTSGASSSVTRMSEESIVMECHTFSMFDIA